MKKRNCGACSRWDDESKHASGDLPDRGICQIAIDSADPVHVVSPVVIVGGHEYYGADLLTHRSHCCAQWSATRT